ncbi:MAG TPA: cyclic nucleotide-binding domain-containing protein [Vicinamibacteria bacterium]|nr:cyclic nucleotide-binding domain-containing protein [Vicinamibacteria bacterium]
MPERRGAIGALERVLHFKAIPAFRGLHNEALSALAESARERFYPRGALVFDESAPIATIQHILDGRVRLARGGHEISRAGPGTPLGALAVLARMPMAVQGTAETDTVTLEIDSDTLLEVCDDHFSVVHNLLRYIARWIVEIEKREGPQGPPVRHYRPVRRLVEGELDLVERIFYLRQFPVFSAASINALAELSRGLTEVRFGPGVPLWSAGDAGPYGLLVVEGTVDCSVPGGPGFAAGQGWALGIMESIAEIPRWHDATTASPVVALHGATEGLIDVFEDSVEMAMNFLSLLARGILAHIERRGPAAVPQPA